MSLRTIGTIFAIVAALTAVALLTWSFYSVASTQKTEQAQHVTIAPMPEIDVDLESEDPNRFENILTGDGPGSVQFLGENDRVESEYRYQDLENLGAGRRRVVEPRAWMYTDDGAAVHIRAARAEFIQPTGSQEPESGRLEGGVIIELFDRGAGRTPSSLADDAGGSPSVPALTIETATLHFDTVGGEARTIDPVTMRGSGYTVNLRDLTALVNESDRRIAYLGASGPGSLRYEPTDQSDQQDDEQEAAPEDDESREQDDQRTAPAAVDFYHAVVRGELSIAGSGVNVAADQLDVWARLIDRSLAADAFAPIEILSADPDGEAKNSPGGAPAERRDGDLTVSWSDGFELRPMDEQPETLSRDDIALRLASPESGNVVAMEETSGALAKCAALDYGLTSRRFTLRGAGDTGVVLAAPEVAETIVGRLEIDLTEGVATIPGPGLIRSLGSAQMTPTRPTAPVNAPSQITWQDAASFVLDIKDGVIDATNGAPLREAIFNDRVRVNSDGAVATSESIRAIFEPGEEGPSISRAILDGDAALDGGEEGRLLADRLDLRFDPAGHDRDRPIPRRVLAEGNVRAERAGATLRSDLAEASLVPLADGALGLDEFNANLGVAVRTSNGVELFADTARVTGAADARVVDLAGQPAIVKRKGATLTANAMRLEESLALLTVFGDGVVNHSQLRDSGLGYQRLQVEWLGSMTYDDNRGIAEFTGGVTSTAMPDALTRDIARGERLVLELSPELAGSLEEVADTVEDAPAIRAARLYGAALELGQGDAAQLEARRYIEDPASPTGLRLERMLYVDAPQILADGVSNRIDIPDPGRMLIEDRREAVSSGGSETAFDLRGTTLFEWAGSAMIDRESGESMMKRRVRVRHTDPAGTTVSDLECERLEVTSDPERSADGAIKNPDAFTVEASGAVYAQHAGKQLIADLLWFQGNTGMIEASAWPGNTVTLFDPQLPAPLTGSTLSWDTVRDRALWRDAAEITIPN